MADSQEFVLLGKVTRAHGIRGEIKVYPFSREPENFIGYRTLFLSPGDGASRKPFTSEKARVQGNQVLLKLAGCSSRNDAELLVGMEVWLRSEDLPALEEDEYYLHELEGKLLVTDLGIELGRVTRILATGAHDILVVRDKKKEYLIPLIPEFLERIEEDRVVMNLPPGLLEINT